MSKKILLVDDDPNILQGYKRQLRKQFQIEIAEGGLKGLEAVRSKGPFAVIVSDMQMPEMNGAQFLSAAGQIAPDSVRMMLTGNADQKTAMDAVNDGNIFRFLTKPCSPEALTKALAAGIEQYRLITAERELLSKTLSGSVSVLTEVLSLVNPTAFGQATSVRRLVREICQSIKVENAWEIEIAAMLCQVGCVTTPETILTKLSEGESLTEEEMEIYLGHPQVGYNLISKIPRLVGSAEIIAYQHKHYDGSGTPVDDKRGEKIPLGSRILKLAIDATQQLTSGKSASDAFSVIKEREGWYDPDLIDLLANVISAEYVIRTVKIAQLEEGMILDEHVMSKGGDILLASGHEVTDSFRERLVAFSNTSTGVREPIRVRCPLGNANTEQAEEITPEPAGAGSAS